MTRAKKARQRRREAAAPPPVRRKGARRQASLKLLVGAALAVLVVAGAAVGIALAVGAGNSSSSTVPTRGSLANALPGAAAAQRMFAGIRQRGNALGPARAPATMIEYVDLQCPLCRDFEATVMPTIVRRFVRTGKLRVVARPIAIIGPDSILGRDAAIAAGDQNKMFDFMQVTYFNQGVENTGWLTDDFVTKAAASVPGMDVPELLRAAHSSSVSHRGTRFQRQATAADIPGTPSLFVGRTGGHLTLVPSNDAPTVIAAIQRALG
jgi:protein-disulfide isomerase